MNRLRNLDIRCSIMPFVLAALVLRALVPAGFMPGSQEGFRFVAVRCAPRIAVETPVVTQRSELPASPGAHARPHCEFCVSPLVGLPPATEHAQLSARVPSLERFAFLPQISTHSPDRAPSARAPPA